MWGVILHFYRWRKEKAFLRELPGGPEVRLCASTSGGLSSIPGQRTKILHAVWCSQKKEKKTFLNSSIFHSQWSLYSHCNLTFFSFFPIFVDSHPIIPALIFLGPEPNFSFRISSTASRIFICLPILIESSGTWRFHSKTSLRTIQGPQISL